MLVVEDDEEVRETAVAMLSDLGYRTLKASDATSALSVIDSGISIDLLFTDVVMPGSLKSAELARKSKERMPGIAVLFTSGYTENSIVHGGRLDAGIELLSKPYTREALARKIRHVISNQTQKNAVAPRAERPETEVLPRVEKAESRLSNADAASRTVLLVEDDGIIRMNTAEMLQDSGLVVVEAASAEEAKAALQTMAVDVLVTDVNLPGASGRELAAAARALQPSVLIVYATGDPASVRDEADAVILSKPYDAALLAKAVSQRSATDDDTEGSKSQISGEQEHI